MKKKFVKSIILYCISLLMFACQEEPDYCDCVFPKLTECFPTSIGSWWVYENYIYDWESENDTLIGYDSTVIVGTMVFEGKEALLFETHHFDTTFHFIEKDTNYYSLYKDIDIYRLYQWVKYFNGEFNWMEIANDDYNNDRWFSDSISTLSDSSYISHNDTITIKQQDKSVLSFRFEFGGNYSHYDTLEVAMQFRKIKTISKKKILRIKSVVIDEQYTEQQVIDDYVFTEKVGLKYFKIYPDFISYPDYYKVLLRYKIK
ncbi:MAG: hypothetical protein V1779_11635 [bacterium]